MERDPGIYRRPNEVATEANAAQKPKDFAKTIKFVEDALGEGAHEKVPERSLDVTLTYLLSPTDISLKKTGKIFSITSERARQIRNQTMSDLWQNSSASTQTRLPWEEIKLNLNKPRKIKPMRVKEMKERPVLKRKKLADDLKNAKTYEEKQKLFNLITRFIYYKFVKGNNPILIGVKTLAAEAGYHMRTSEDYVLVRNTIIAVVPVGEIPANRTAGKIYSYHFILAVDVDKAKETLHNNKDLDPFLKHPVVQILGPKEDQLPSTYLLKSFGRFNKLLFQLEINPGEQRLKVIKWLIAQNDCPAQVYYHDGKLYYHLSQEADLQNYIEKKMQEIVLAAA